MRPVSTSLATLVLMSGLWGADGATPGVIAPPTPAVTPASPEVVATGWALALRRNDPAGAFALLTPADQASLATMWRNQMRRPDAYADLQIDTLLRIAQHATAADQVLALSQPYLAQVDVAKLTRGIQEIAGFLAMAADTQQPGNPGALDYSGLRDWLRDLAAWVPTAGLTDQPKAKAAATHLVQALKASGLTSAAELRALPLADLLARLAPAMPALKQALAVYDVQVDALLGSFTATLDGASPEQATIVLGFTSLDKPRTVTLKLVQQDGAWRLASGNDNPLTGLSQLLMMSLLMQGMGTVPAQPPTIVQPEDDGAL